MDHHPGFSDWLLLILLALIWGSSFILMQEGLKAFRPDQVAALRIGITGITLLPLALARRKEVTKQKVRTIFLQGLFGNFLPAFLFPIAQTQINSSTAGILNSLSPVWVFVLGCFFFRSNYTWLKLLGTTCAFLGVILLMLFQPRDNTDTKIYYGLIIVVATLSYGISASIIKKYLQEVRAITIAAITFSLVLIPAIIYLFATGITITIDENPLAIKSLFHIALLAIFGSAIASILFNRLVQSTTALFASAVSYLIPVVALFWGLIAGEQITLTDFAGMVLILAGVYIISR